VVAGHDTDLRLLLAFVGLNSDSERAPSPRKTCPSVVLRVLGKFPPHRRPIKPFSGHAKLNSERFPERAPQGARRRRHQHPSRRANASKRYADTRAMLLRTILDCILANEAILPSLRPLPKVNAQPGIVAPHHFAGLL
jgi:hypothetical protein